MNSQLQESGLSLKASSDRIRAGVTRVFRASYNHEFSTTGIGAFPEGIFGPDQSWRDAPGVMDQAN
jgi:hypothetical protein